MSVVLTAIGTQTTSQQVLQLDASVKEDVTFDAEVTEHPVEQGSDIADNVRVKLVSLTIEGVLSDWPMGTNNQTSPAVPGHTGRAFELVIQVLQQWLINAQLLSVTTPLKQYGDNTGTTGMVIQSLTVPNEAQLGDTAHITLRLKQISIVSSQTVAVTIPKAKVSKGNQSVKPAETGTTPGYVTAYRAGLGTALVGGGGNAASGVSLDNLPQASPVLQSYSAIADYTPANANQSGGG